MNNTLISNYQGKGEDIMVFSSPDITHEMIRCALVAKGIQFEDLTEVPDKDLQYHLYEPCWLEPAAEAGIRKIYESVNKK